MEGKDDSISICSSPSPIIPDSLFGTTNVTSSWYNNNNNGGIAHIPHSDGLGFIPEEIFSKRGLKLFSIKSLILAFDVIVKKNYYSLPPSSQFYKAMLFFDR